MSGFLKSTIALSAALLLTIFGATIQGRYAYRWAIPTALPSAVHRLSTIPHNFQDWKCVDTLKFKEETINAIKWLYRQTKFWVNEKEISIGAGVVQGGVLSPTLFIIMFDDLIKELEKRDMKYSPMQTT